ncbi:YibE/F family protein [Patescibacteria group bacterium]|nr:MAG: YibE/F family protein [Patescibacteria group bacterium]
MVTKTNKKFAFVLFFFFCVVMPAPVLGQEGFTAREAEATIIEILSVEDLEGGVRQYIFKAQTPYGEEFLVETADSFVSGVGFELKTGDKVYLRMIEVEDGIEVYLDDVKRQTGVWWIIGFFVLITLAIGLLRGLLSLLGLGITIVILIGGLFPAILAGNDPVLATVVASAIILGVNMHLSHGFKRQTFFAYLSTLGGLGLVLVFTDVFLNVARLSGLASEEGALLFWELDPVQIPVGILAAGLILGAVGVLDDIAITQSEIVSELLLANPHTTRKELFTKAMRIGRHHIASAVNTLILVYAGAALPAFLLFMNQFGGYQEFLQNEIVAEEVVRTLAGTCALVLLVPLSTWFATLNPRVRDHEKT